MIACSKLSLSPFNSVSNIKLNFDVRVRVRRDVRALMISPSDDL